MRFRSQKSTHNKPKMYKLQRMFEAIVMVFYDMAFAYEGKVSPHPYSIERFLNDGNMINEWRVVQ